MKKKLAVYICHCGGNISDYVDVEQVLAAIKGEEGVILAKTTLFACADANQKEMEKDIRELQLDGVVVASCSPKLHQTTFRAVVERAGLNKYNYVHANIREQGSWAHSDDKSGATNNAVHVVKAAIAKVRDAKALDPIQIDSEQAVAVLGAGVSGMRAAIELARTGIQVHLIEKDFWVGGRAGQWGLLFPDDEKGEDLIRRLYEQILDFENISLYLGTEIVARQGSIGNYTLTLRINPTRIKGKCTEESMRKGVELCPVKVKDTYNYGLSERKAVYRNRPGQMPDRYIIDSETCTKCGDCVGVCEHIDLDQKEMQQDIRVGSVVFAIGYDTYEPEKGEFSYGDADQVITLPRFRRLLEQSEGSLKYRGREIKTIAWIYCVGSRQPEGENKYCSRYCCTTAIYTALETKKRYPRIKNYHFTRGVRTYGKNEVYYAEALRQGDVFFQSEDTEPPVVSQDKEKITVSIKDILTERRELSLDADLVVLVTSMVPRRNSTTAELFKLPKGRDQFLKEVHLKLRPVETVIDGITIAGTCQGPMNIMESVNSALSAATKAYSYVSKGKLELEPIVAKVDQDACIWCDACSASCPFDVISQVTKNGKKVAAINESVCKGCGMCLPVCPENAIELSTFTDQEVDNMIDMLAKD